MEEKALQQKILALYEENKVFKEQFRALERTIKSFRKRRKLFVGKKMPSVRRNLPSKGWKSPSR